MNNMSLSESSGSLCIRKIDGWCLENQLRNELGGP